MRSILDAKKIAALAPRMGGLIDQAFFSGIYFIQTAAYVRHLSTAEFGVFSLFYYTLVLVISVQRAVVITPMIVSTPTDRMQEIRIWQSGALVISIGIAMLFLVGALYWFIQKQGVSHISWLYCALGAVPLLAFEFHRRSLFLQRRPIAAASSSAVFFVLQGLGTALAIYLKIGLVPIIGIYVFNSMLAAVVASRLSMKELPATSGHFMEMLKKNQHTISWNLASLAPYMVYNNAMPLLISFFFGIKEAAIYSATRVLVAPIMMLVSAVDSTDKPRAARALQQEGIAGLMKSLRKTGVTLLVLAAPYLLLLAFFPQHILVLAIGHKYAQHVELIPYWIAIGLLFLVGQPLESGLIVLRRSDLFFWSRMLAASLTVLLLFLNRGAAGALSGVRSTSVAWGISTVVVIGLMVMVAGRWRSAQATA